jgi:hypothetical protein
MRQGLSKLLGFNPNQICIGRPVLAKRSRAVESVEASASSHRQEFSDGCCEPAGAEQAAKSGRDLRAVGPFAKRQPTVESRRLGAVGYGNRNTRAPEARYQIRR